MSPWLSDVLLRTQTDERLVTLAHLGHKRAFELIVERYRRPLTAYARRVDARRAEDLVQQTFLSALTALQAGAEVRHLRGWLYEILRNHIRRDYSTTTVLAELDDTESAVESAQQVAERRMLAMDALSAMAQLPTRQHDALVQTAFHGLSRTEVANTMGLSEGAVRQLVHRARSTLRTAVTAITPMPVLRWLTGTRSGSAAGLAEATIGAGSASSAGIALKLGVGAVLASGAVAGGVITAVSHHHRAIRIAMAKPAADVRGAGHGSSGPANGREGRSLAGGRAHAARSGGSGHRGRRSSGGHRRSGADGLTFGIGRDGLATGGDHGSRSGSDGSGRGDGGSTSGGGGHDGGGGPGPSGSGPGSGDHGSGGSDGGSNTSGSGPGTSSGDGGSGSSGSDGGSATVSGTDGGSGGGGGVTTSGSSSGSSGDGSSLTTGDGSSSSSTSGSGSTITTGDGGGFTSTGGDGGGSSGSSGGSTSPDVGSNSGSGPDAGSGADTGTG